MKRNIAVALIVVILGSVGYWLFQENQTKKYKEAVIPIYNAYKVLIDDGNKVGSNIAGRSFDNIFSDLNGLKKKNQDLKIKLVEMSPPNAVSMSLSQQFKATLDAHDEALVSLIFTIEQQRNYQLRSWDKNSQDFKTAEDSYKNAIDKNKVASASSREERKKLQAMLGIEVDKYLVSP